MSAINIKTATKVTPQCYAYTLPGVSANDGWTKIGFTERDVETRVKEQTHTAGITPKICWHYRAAYMTEPYGNFTGLPCLSEETRRSPKKWDGVV